MALGAALAGAVASVVMTTAIMAPRAELSSQTQVAQIPSGGVIGSVRVEGLQRIEPATVASYLLVKAGDVFETDRLDESLKTLFATGLFADVFLRREGNALVVVVKENPIINRIAFEGNRRLDDEQLQREVQLRPRVVYTQTRVQSDVQRVLDLYRRNGRFAASVEPKIVTLDENRVDLIFEVDEGPRTGVGRISFVGNKAFSDGSLREEIQTRETRWYRFLSSDDAYDPDRLAYDKELLRRFYLTRGYADFRVVSGVAELAPERDAFYITFTVEEGERYHFGKVDVESHLKGLDAGSVKGVLTTTEGSWYNAEAVETSILKLTQAVGERQYQFVEVRPRIERNRETMTVDVTYEIHEGQRTFVERIEVSGNVRTQDKVIRREMLVVEGDPFNASKLKRSEQRIKDLNFFEKVNVSTVEGSGPDQAVVQVDVAEQSTGEIMLGAGFSTVDGPLADFGVRERNLLGKGQDLRFATLISKRRKEIDVSFTEPYFLDRDLSAGIDLFRITRDNQDESSYDENNTGFTLRMGYPLSERLRQRLSYTLEYTKIENIDKDASLYVRDQEGGRLVSIVAQDLLYDARDSKLNPTDGYFLRMVNELAGAGGDARFLRNRISAGIYFPLADQWVLNLAGEVGYTFALGEDEVFIADRFFLGGDSMRGFAVSGIGPRDLASARKDAVGGTRYYRGTAEMSFPLGLPEEMGFNGYVFSDVGSLGRSTARIKPGTNLQDDESMRLSVGAGLGWRSPMGPLRLDLAFPLLKESYDEIQQFRFSFGTRF